MSAPLSAASDVSPPANPFVGRRVALVPLTPDHYEWVYRLATGPWAGTRWRLGGRVPLLEHFVQMLMSEGDANHLLCRRDDGRPLGFVQLYRCDHVNGHAAVSAALSPETAGKGWPIEGLALFVDHVFSTWRFRKLYIEAATSTLAQYGDGLLAVADEEGCLRGHEYRGGIFEDVHLLAVHRERWAEVSHLALPARVSTTSHADDLSQSRRHA